MILRKKHFFISLVVLFAFSFSGCKDNSRRIVFELNSGDVIGGQLVGTLLVNTTVAQQPLAFQLFHLKEVDLLNSSNGQVKVETQDGNVIEGYIASSSLSIISSGQRMSFQISDIKKISIE